MELQEGLVEPVDVVGEEVDHLTDCRLAEGSVGELQSFPVEEGAGGHPELHAGVLQFKEIGVSGEAVQGCHRHHSSSVEVSFSQGDPAVRAEILYQPACRITVR